MPIQINELIIKANVAQESKEPTKIAKEQIKEIVQTYASAFQKQSSNRKNER